MALPFIPLAAAAVTAGTNLFGQSQQRKHNRRAEQDARDHNKEMWNLTNEYNHPSQQMARLQEAGLNPNMIYGTSPSSAVGTAGDVSPGKAPDQPFEMQNPMEEMSRHFNIEQAKAQTDNLRVHNTVQQQDALYRASQTANEGIKGARNQFDLDLARELRETSMDAARENVRQIRHQNHGQYLQNYFNDATMSNRIESIGLQIDNARATLTGQNLENKMKQFETELNQLGMTKNDPLFQRLMYTGKVYDVGDSVFDGLQRTIFDTADKVRDALGPKFKERFPKR